MEVACAVTLQSSLKLPCTCRIWKQKKTYLIQLRKEMNGFCQANQKDVVCRNVAACIGQEVQHDFVGSWIFDVANSSGAQMTGDEEEIAWFLDHFDGKLEGVADDFVRIRVECSHSHKHLMK